MPDMFNVFFNEDFLAHIGNKNSGRYPRGSGERPYQHDRHLKGRHRSEIQKSYDKAKKVDRREAADALLKQNIKGGKDKPNQSALERSVYTVSKSVDATKNIDKDIRSIKNRKKKEVIYRQEAEKVSKMSDQELRDFVNRRNLEKQYLNVITNEQIDDGNSKLADILDVAGDVVSIVGGGVVIAATLYNMKK